MITNKILDVVTTYENVNIKACMITNSFGMKELMKLTLTFAVVFSDRPTATPAAPHLPLRRLPRRHRGHLPGGDPAVQVAAEEDGDLRVQGGQEPSLRY